MSWETFYLVAFVVGLLLSLFSLLAGGLHVGHFHVGHLHFHGGGHGHGGGGHGGASPFNLGTIAIFLAWFGGTGYALQHYSTLWTYLSLGIAMLSGGTGAFAAFWFLSKLTASGEPLDPADYEMVGVLGKVTSPIRKNGTGEILFLRDGSRKAAAARCEEPMELPRDTEVIVTRFERGIAYVRRWEDFQ
jgi:membrane protein implicated in regulation of membrane protease activity